MVKGNNTSTKKKSFTRGSDTLFPGKLHSMMDFVEQKGLEYIISWVQNGTAIQIHDPKRLVTDVLPFFFGQTRVRSFHRQFYMWRFERLTEGISKGAFAHPFFLKGQKSLCTLMSRHIDPARQLQQLQEMISTAATASNSVNMMNSIQQPTEVATEPLPIMNKRVLPSPSSTTSLFSLGFEMKLNEENGNNRCFQSSSGFARNMGQDLFELPSLPLSAQPQHQQVDDDELTIGTIENVEEPTTMLFNDDDFNGDPLFASVVIDIDYHALSKLDDSFVVDPIMELELTTDRSTPIFAV